MKIKCAQSELVSALQLVQTASSSKTSLMILNNVLLECFPDKIRLTTTDLEIGLICDIPAECSGIFSITVPVKRLYSLVRELPGDNLEIEIIDNNFIKIVQDRSEYKINCLPDTEFPKFPSFDGSTSFTLPQEALKDIISKTSYAICRDEGRYVLTGLYMSLNQDGVVSVATDGRRLSFVQKNVSLVEGLERVIIIPFKAISEISKLVQKEKDVKISILENQILLTFENCKLFSRLIDGHFPNYKQVIPEESGIKIDIERDSFYKAVRRVSLLTTDMSNQVKVGIRQNCLTLEVSNSECGEAKEEVPVKYEGEEFDIAFNPVYLLDVLKSLDDEFVTFELTNSSKPGVIKSGNEFVYVIMPMRIS